MEDHDWPSRWRWLGLLQFLAVDGERIAGASNLTARWHASVQCYNGYTDRYAVAFQPRGMKGVSLPVGQWVDVHLAPRKIKQVLCN